MQTLLSLPALHSMVSMLQAVLWGPDCGNVNLALNACSSFSSVCCFHTQNRRAAETQAGQARMRWVSAGSASQGPCKVLRYLTALATGRAPCWRQAKKQPVRPGGRTRTSEPPSERHPDVVTGQCAYCRTVTHLLFLYYLQVGKYTILLVSEGPSIHGEVLDAHLETEKAKSAENTQNAVQMLEARNTGINQFPLGAQRFSSLNR